MTSREQMLDIATSLFGNDEAEHQRLFMLLVEVGLAYRDKLVAGGIQQANATVIDGLRDHLEM